MVENPYDKKSKKKAQAGRGGVEWPEVPPDFDIYVREEMRAVEREEEEKRRKTRGGKRK